jgi:hypothetical protein
VHPDWLGSPQHAIAGALLAVALAVVAARTSDVSPWLIAPLAVAVTMGAEALVELVEYPLMYAGDQVSETAYLDTVADIASTLGGAVVGAGVWLAVSVARA